ICMDNPAVFGIFTPLRSDSISLGGRLPSSGLFGTLAKLLDAGAAGASAEAGGADGARLGANSCGVGFALSIVAGDGAAEITGGVGDGPTTAGGSAGATGTGAAVSTPGGLSPWD